MIKGAAVFTADDNHPRATALAVKDDMIVFVGDDGEAERWVGASTRLIELGGQSVLPGLHDSHVHPMNGGMRRLRCGFLGARSRAAVFRTARNCAERPRVESWLIGYGVEFELFDGKPPALADLDAISSTAPVFFTSNVGDVALVNTPALVAAGLAPEIGAVVKGADALRVRSAIPAPTRALYRAALKASLARMASLGVTSFIDAAVSPEMLEAYVEADKAGELSARAVLAQRISRDAEASIVRDFAARATAARSEWLRADAAKFFLDGDFGGRSAALLAPYADAPEASGGLLIEEERFGRIVAALQAADFQIHVHAFGDQAVRVALNQIEATATAEARGRLRHHLAHLGLVDRSDASRFAALGVAADIHPTLPFEDERDAARLRARLGDRAAEVFPFAALAAANAPIVVGSDWPSPSDAPLELLAMALAREKAGSSIDLDRLLRALTSDAAYYARSDEKTGSITVGKAADIVVFDCSLQALASKKLARASVLMTMVGGRTVYCAAAFECPE